MSKKIKGISKKDTLSISEIRKLTEESKNNIQTKYNDACDEALKYIIEGSNDKIREAAQNGKNRAFIYLWHYLDDRNDKKFSFCGVKIMDIITKGPLLEKLREHFNPTNDKDDFFVNWMKFKKKNESDQTQYGIYVSWYIPKEKTIDE